MAVGLPALAGAALGIFGFAGLFSEPQLDYFGVKLEIDGNRLVVDKSNKCNNGPHNNLSFVRGKQNRCHQVLSHGQ